MEKILVEGTKYSPYMLLDSAANLIELRGESYPENTTEFYGVLMTWLDTYLAEMGNQELTVNIQLVYFNSSSSKVLMDILDALEEAAGLGKSVVVNWIYDKDNDMAEEYGEEFAEDITHLTFNMVCQ